MSDGNYLTKPLSDQIVQFAANASLQIDIGDLLYMETDDVRPAGSQADQTSETLNQRLFASKFAGIAHSSRQLANAVAGNVGVLVDVLMEYPIVSTTLEVGDLVGADERSNGTQLENQQVRKVTDKDLAIGVVMARYPSATTKAWIRFTSRVAPNVAAKATPAAALTAALTALTTADTNGSPDYALQAVINSSAWGFASQAELISFIYVVKNMQTRLGEVEAALEAAGIVVAN